MNNETMRLLEQQFDTAFAAPDGIQKLRELILTLAMQGKLVPQDPSDQPASELLKEIEVEKSRLVKEGIFRGKDNQDFSEKKSFFLIPETWQSCTIQDLGFVLGGKRLPKGHSYAESPTSHRYITVTNMKNNTIVDNEVKFIRPETHAEISKYIITKNDLYITIAGTIGFVGSIPENCDGMNLTENAARIVFFECDKTFLVYLLNSRVVQDQFTVLTNTMAQPKLSLRSILSTSIPLPPLAEQHRIVAKIDQLMARCDELEKLRSDRAQKLITVHTAALNRLLTAQDNDDFTAAWHFITQHFSELYSVKETVAELRKTILQLAVMGKLVPQESAPKTASLQSILAEASINGVSKGPTSDTSATEILRISAGTSQKDFYVNEDDFKHVDLSVDEIQKFQLIPGDLLACRFNGNLHYVGRFSYYRGESGRVQVNPDKLIRFRVDPELCCPRYVCYMMNASQTREAIEAMCATTAGNIGLSAGRLKTIEIPCPPLDEQQRIVAKIDQLMALCDRLEAAIAAAQTKQTDLLNALMAQV